MGEQRYFYQSLLKAKLAERTAKNPRYSLRAFAQSLTLQPGALSQILSGKRSLSTKLASRVFRRLELTPEQEVLFLQSIAEARITQGAKRMSPSLLQVLNRNDQKLEISRELSHEVFRSISEWYHFAILELTTVADFKSDFRWISSRLGISQIDAKLAIERLIELGLITAEKGQYKKTDLRIDTLEKSKTTSAHRNRQKQILEKSLQSLEHDPIESRNHSGVTFAMDASQMDYAKERIQKFLWELSEELSTQNKSQVYELSVNLIPLSKEISK